MNKQLLITILFVLPALALRACLKSRFLAQISVFVGHLWSKSSPFRHISYLKMSPTSFCRLPDGAPGSLETGAALWSDAPYCLEALWTSRDG